MTSNQGKLGKVDADTAEPRRSGRTSGTYHLARPLNVDKSRIDPHLVSLVDPLSMEAECYRRLRYSLELAKQVDDAGVFAICSAAAGDGKTVTCINLAGAVAQDPEARVILIELDLRKPFSSAAAYLGLGQRSVRPGLIDKIRDSSVMWGEVVSYLPEFNLHIMSAGKKTSKPYEVLKSKRLGRLLAEARQRYDFVIVDTPPILLLPDSQLISRWIDRMMVVVTADKTSKAHLEETLACIDADKMLGFVFNGRTPRHMESYYDYAYPELRANRKPLVDRILDYVNPRLGRDA